MIKLKAVKTYNGYKYGERPKSFEIEGETVLVIDLIETQLIKDRESKEMPKTLFKVRGNDGKIYRIIYNAHEDSWYLK